MISAIAAVYCMVDYRKIGLMFYVIRLTNLNAILICMPNDYIFIVTPHVCILKDFENAPLQIGRSVNYIF